MVVLAHSWDEIFVVLKEKKNWKQQIRLEISIEVFQQLFYVDHNLQIYFFLALGLLWSFRY